MHNVTSAYAPDAFRLFEVMIAGRLRYPASAGSTVSQQRDERACNRCGHRLARDNARVLCNACARASVADAAAAPTHSAAFWQHPKIEAALQARHFGRLMFAYRLAHDPPVRQAQLGYWLGLTQGQVSRIERSSSPVRDLDRLERWARALHVPLDKLWFQLDTHAGDASEEVEAAPNLPSKANAGGEDVRRRELLRTAALGVASLGASSVGQAGRSTVGSTDISILQEMTATFRRLDNRYGGGHARSTVAHYLAYEVQPKLRDGRTSSGIRRELCSAVAELHHLAGWMAHDTGDAKAGRMHLQQALRLCREAEDDALAAEMLAGMSHQSAFAGQPTMAVDLALAASQTAAHCGVGRLRAEAATMEAHALALVGDTRGCVSAMQAAEKAFVSHGGPDGPDWLTYFDEAYMAAKFAHCFRELGRPVEAERFARRSLEMTEGYERGRFFNTALLASTLADQRRVEEACETATAAMAMASVLRSSRASAYLADIARRLTPHLGTPAAKLVLDRMAAVGVGRTAH